MKTILFLISSMGSTILFGQSKTVKLELSSTKVQAGQEITITVKSTVQGNMDIDLPKEYVQGYNMMNGMTQEMDYKTGQMTTLLYCTQNGSFNKYGKFIVGPAYIKSGDKIYESNVVEVTVIEDEADQTTGKVNNKQLGQLAFGIIETNKDVLYEGEPLIVNAKIYSKFMPTGIEDYQGCKINLCLDKYNLSSGQQITTKKETLKGQEYFSLEYDRSVIFPSTTGKIQVKPFKLILTKNNDGLPIASPPHDLTIKPLPRGAPSSFTGMVGEMTIDCAYSGRCESKGDILHCDLTISGCGNLHNFENFELNLPKNLTCYGKPERTENFSFSSKGCEGQILFRYSLKALTDGAKSIPQQKFSFFNPKTKEYITLNTEAYESATAPRSPETSQRKGSTQILKSTSNNPLESNQTDKKSGTAYWPYWLGILGSIALGTWLFIFKKPTIKENLATTENSGPVMLNEEMVHSNFEVSNLSQAKASLLISMAQKTRLQHTLTPQKDLIKHLADNHSEELALECKNMLDGLDSAVYGLNLSIEDEDLLHSKTSELIHKINETK